MTTVLDTAKFYISKGWDVFPCRPKDKTPAVKWAEEATRDAAKIAEWFTGSDYNIGIATGARSGIVVLDIDAGHDGEKTLAELVRANGEMPSTPIALTGGGGRHFLFAHPGVEVRNSASKVGLGIDVRGDGGYIVAAPSIHPSGTAYRWDTAHAPSRTSLAQIPAWLLNAMTSRQALEYPQSPANIPAAPAGGAFAPGGRNQALTSLAGTMRRRGMGEAAILVAIQAENMAKCVPPLSETEIRNIVKSVMRYEPGAAPVSQNGERIRVEWAFARAIYDIPELVKDFAWITPEQFGDQNLRQYWQAILTGDGVIEAANKAEILIDIEKVEANPDLVDKYADTIGRYGYLESVKRAAQDIQYFAEQGDTEKVTQIIETMGDKKPSANISAKGAFDGLMELQDAIDNGRQFIKTKIPNLDRILGGLERRKTSILAARPSVGKTTLAWQIARNVAASGHRVLFLSLEVSAVSLWRKAAYGLAEIKQADVEAGTVPAEKMEHVRTEIIPALIDAYNDRLYTYDDPPFTPNALWKVALQSAPDLIIIDHLDRVEDTTEKQVERLGKITKWAGKLSKEGNCHVMILHQLNRAVEQREHKEPMLSDLRDSGHVEQDADVVIMPFRPDYHESNPIKMRYSETMLFIRKNRDGETGVVQLYFDLLHQWFYRKDELPPNWKGIGL